MLRNLEALLVVADKEQTFLNLRWET